MWKIALRGLVVGTFTFEQKGGWSMAVKWWHLWAWMVRCEMKWPGTIYSLATGLVEAEKGEPA